MMFPCNKCGACCRNLHLSPLYAKLDRGDGVCKYLSGDLCSIYGSRPLLCRVDESYEKFFKDVMSLEDYYQLNRKTCEELKKTKKLEE